MSKIFLQKTSQVCSVEAREVIAEDLAEEGRVEEAEDPDKEAAEEDREDPETSFWWISGPEL